MASNLTNITIIINLEISSFILYLFYQRQVEDEEAQSSMDSGNHLVKTIKRVTAKKPDIVLST